MMYKLIRMDIMKNTSRKITRVSFGVAFRTLVFRKRVFFIWIFQYLFCMRYSIQYDLHIWVNYPFANHCRPFLFQQNINHVNLSCSMNPTLKIKSIDPILRLGQLQ